MARFICCCFCISGLCFCIIVIISPAQIFIIIIFSGHTVEYFESLCVTLLLNEALIVVVFPELFVWYFCWDKVCVEPPQRFFRSEQLSYLFCFSL